jgi:hypothetical protein
LSEEDRQFYIDWLRVSYPFKAESYFAAMSDQELLREYERTLEII